MLQLLTDEQYEDAGKQIIIALNNPEAQHPSIHPYVLADGFKVGSWEVLIDGRVDLRDVINAMVMWADDNLSTS